MSSFLGRRSRSVLNRRHSKIRSRYVDKMVSFHSVTVEFPNASLQQNSWLGFPQCEKAPGHFQDQHLTIRSHTTWVIVYLGLRGSTTYTRERNASSCLRFHEANTPEKHHQCLTFFTAHIQKDRLQRYQIKASPNTTTYPLSCCIMGTEHWYSGTLSVCLSLYLYLCLCANILDAR